MKIGVMRSPARGRDQTIRRVLASSVSALALAALAGQAEATTYDYTGAVQTITIGAGTWNLTLAGAAGGSASGYAGQSGVISSGTVTFATPQTFELLVGGQGVYGFDGGGGGGGSFLFYQGGGGTPLALMVAGGGGGGVVHTYVSGSVAYTHAGNGGGITYTGKGYDGSGGASYLDGSAGGAGGLNAGAGGFGGGGGGGGGNGGGGGGKDQQGVGSGGSTYYSSFGGYSFYGFGGQGGFYSQPAVSNQYAKSNNEENGYFTVVSSVVAAPEPSTWALSITGFGLLGYILRRRARRAMRPA
ncbi:MAG TPA: PEPxxWA-CTERM sorting domain-containing protein [Caulobacteraceae bacterium]|jgi:hypothetical protein|nr:PEPxxWA-CTERM sorting domain-containing protein [Caulobacteraceae bacterium]